MKKNLFQGDLVRLTLENADSVAKNFSLWSQDSEYSRLSGSDPARLFSSKATQQWIEKEFLSQNPTAFSFFIRTLDDNRLIGFIGLDGISWTHGDTYVGIGIGERNDWGKGYGTDAMRLVLQYAFEELNLHRVTLNVFAYNPRAIRSYEKTGFRVEGRIREFLNRDGQRWDMVHMGILRSEWEAVRQNEGQAAVVSSE